jgi:hypothetical protein
VCALLKSQLAVSSDHKMCVQVCRVVCRDVNSCALANVSDYKTKFSKFPWSLCVDTKYCIGAGLQTCSLAKNDFCHNKTCLKTMGGDQCQNDVLQLMCHRVNYVAVLPWMM